MGLRDFFEECKRVYRVTKKPNKEEFSTVVKAAALGITVIGVIGLLISIVNQLLTQR